MEQPPTPDWDKYWEDEPWKLLSRAEKRLRPVADWIRHLGSHGEAHLAWQALKRTPAPVVHTREFGPNQQPEWAHEDVICMVGSHIDTTRAFITAARVCRHWWACLMERGHTVVIHAGYVLPPRNIASSSWNHHHYGPKAAARTWTYRCNEVIHTETHRDGDTGEETTVNSRDAIMYSLAVLPSFAPHLSRLHVDLSTLCLGMLGKENVLMQAVASLVNLTSLHVNLGSHADFGPRLEHEGLVPPDAMSSKPSKGRAMACGWQSCLRSLPRLKRVSGNLGFVRYGEFDDDYMVINSLVNLPALIELENHQLAMNRQHAQPTWDRLFDEAPRVLGELQLECLRTVVDPAAEFWGKLEPQLRLHTLRVLMTCGERVRGGQVSQQSGQAFREKLSACVDFVKATPTLSRLELIICGEEGGRPECCNVEYQSEAWYKKIDKRVDRGKAHYWQQQNEMIRRVYNKEDEALWKIICDTLAPLRDSGLRELVLEAPGLFQPYQQPLSCDPTRGEDGEDRYEEYYQDLSAVLGTPVQQSTGRWYDLCAGCSGLC